MPPTKKLKQTAATKTKKCVCGQVFTTAKAFGRHAVGCINHHSSLSTRVLRYGAVQPHVEPPQQVDMSLSSQRRTILNAPRGSSSFASSDVMEQQQLDHVAAYNSQLTFMRGATMMPIEDSGGNATQQHNKQMGIQMMRQRRWTRRHLRALRMTIMVRMTTTMTDL